MSEGRRSAVAGARRLGLPVPVRVRADAQSGRPLAVDGRAIDAIRESWLVEDRWWTAVPLRRRYWEAVTESGANVVVFRDLLGGGWFVQR